MLFPGWWLVPGLLIEAGLIYLAHPRPSSVSSEPEDGKLCVLEGTIESSPELLTAPTSGQECVAWHLLMLTEASETTAGGEAAPFLLRTKAGRIWISLPWGWKANARMLEHRHFESKKDDGSPPWDGREGRLQVGDSVTVSGVFRREPEYPSVAPEKPSTEEAIPRWQLGGMDPSSPAIMAHGSFRATLGVFGRVWRGLVGRVGLPYAGGLTAFLWFIDHY
jgi:hypothetical protein